jgi:hypothetical protein
MYYYYSKEKKRWKNPRMRIRNFLYKSCVFYYI